MHQTYPLGFGDSDSPGGGGDENNGPGSANTNGNGREARGQYTDINQVGVELPMGVSN